MSIARELEMHATQELQHAIEVARHIDSLGGTLTATPKPVKLTGDLPKCCAPISTTRTTPCATIAIA